MMGWFKKKVCSHKHKQVGSSLKGRWIVYQCEKCDNLMMGGMGRSMHLHTVHDSEKFRICHDLELKRVISVYECSTEPNKDIMIETSPKYNMMCHSFYGRIVGEDEEFERRLKECEEDDVLSLEELIKKLEDELELIKKEAGK